MLLSGDEFANTQFGNNNAYCQDNEISWLDWNRLPERKDLHRYVRCLIALRMAHPVLCADRFDFGKNGTGYPELSFHGIRPWELDMTQPTLVFAYLYAEDHKKYGTKKDAFIYIAVNAHWEEHTFYLPVIPDKMKWHLAAEAYGGAYETGRERITESQDHLTLGARSTAILIAK